MSGPSTRLRAGPSTTLWAGLRQAFSVAVDGLRYAMRTQRTFRIHLALAAAVMVLVIWLQLPAVEAAMVILAMAVVLAAELFNTGVEAIVDLLVERNQHQLAKVAKDIAAGAVLLAAVAAAVVGLLILGPPLASAVGLRPGLATQVSRAVALLIVIGGAAGLLRLFWAPDATRRAPSADPGNSHGR